MNVTTHIFPLPLLGTWVGFSPTTNKAQGTASLPGSAPGGLVFTPAAALVRTTMLGAGIILIIQDKETGLAHSGSSPWGAPATNDALWVWIYTCVNGQPSPPRQLRP